MRSTMARYRFFNDPLEWQDSVCGGLKIATDLNVQYAAIAIGLGMPAKGAKPPGTAIL